MKYQDLIVLLETDPSCENITLVKQWLLSKSQLSKSVESVAHAFLRAANNFDLAAYLAWIESKEAEVPVSEIALDEFKDEYKKFIETRPKPDEWELLDINWDEFHKDAKQILDDPFFWTPTNDYAPHGNDIGLDVLEWYKSRRTENIKENEETFLCDLLAEWGFDVDNFSLVDDDRSCNQSVIALAFAHFKLEGSCTEWSGHAALQAIERMRLSASEKSYVYLDKLEHKLLEFFPDFKVERIEQEGIRFSCQSPENECETKEKDQSEQAARIENLPINQSKVILRNSDPNGSVWVEARLSNTGQPFNSLPMAKGFPRWIEKDESVEIDLSGRQELLYRRGMYSYDLGLTAENMRLSWALFRVGNPRNLSVVKGYLFEFPRLDFHREQEAYTSPAETLQESGFDGAWFIQRTYRGSKYVIEPICKEDGYDEGVCQLFLRVTDVRNGKVGERLIVESGCCEVLRFLDEIKIKEGVIQIIPDDGHAIRARGFQVPLEVPIDLILNG